MATRRRSAREEQRRIQLERKPDDQEAARREAEERPQRLREAFDAARQPGHGDAIRRVRVSIGEVTFYG